jgi:hypothetical protein
MRSARTASSDESWSAAFPPAAFPLATCLATCRRLKLDARPISNRGAEVKIAVKIRKMGLMENIVFEVLF